MNDTYKIMLIEDSRTQAERVRSLFEREGWAVILAQSAENALDQLNRARPDLVVVDYHLPGMNGEEFCREIRMNVNHRGIPVLMLTVEGTHDAERRGLESGADDYFSKSGDPDILVLRARSLLRTSAGADRILAPSDNTFSRARLLAVDDSPTFLHYLTEQLQAEHYRVEKAHGGKEALERIRTETFDCVVVDLEMPDIDGIELCRRVEAMRTETNLPVTLLALTAHEQKDFATRALEAGADDFVGKSADIGVLKARIRALLRRKFFVEENRRIVEELKEKELAAVRARAEKEAAEVRAVMADQLAQSNRELEDANRRLKEALEVTKAITENAAEALFMTDREGRITFTNPAAERMFGFRRDELLGMVLHETLHSHRKDGTSYPIEECPLFRSLTTGETVTGQEELFFRKDGTAVEVACSNAPILEAGEVVAAVMVAHDISERKRSEERIRQSQKLESIGMLAGGVAHDFNNILTGIIGTASLIEENEETSPATLEQARTILSGAERAADLTRQLLAYSGKGQFFIRDVDLSVMIRQMGGLIRLSIPKNAGVHLDLEDGIPPVAADPGQMQQVVLNLVVNAGEAIGQARGGVVSIATGTQTVVKGFIDAAGAEVAPGPYAFLEVRDTGSGMDEATQARMFEPFFSTKFTGRGLGLAAISGIMRSQKGGIVVTSAPGAGSTFRVLFPAARAAVVEKTPAESRPAVLVADDEECVRNFLRDALERHGYLVIPAGDGREALDRFEERRGNISLVLIDLTMPVMGGRDLVAELKRRYPEAKVLLTSAYSETEARLLVSAYPGTGFIQKPFSSQALLQKVKAALA